jgi:ribonuclease E
MIETDPGKAAVAVPVAEAPRHAPRRRPRPRDVYGIENEEPLQQVETHTHR